MLSNNTVSIIIVNWNTYDDTANLVKSLLETNISQEIIIVDNNSPKGDGKRLSKTFSGIEQVIVILAEANLGFPKACNIAANQAHGELLLFLNPDTIITKDALMGLLSVLISDETYGLVGPQIIGVDGHIQLSAATRITPWTIFLGGPWLFRLANIFGYNPKIVGHCYSMPEHKKQLFPDWVVGACLLVRRHVFTKIKGFDEQFFMYYEETDLCLRIKNAGYKVVYDPSVSIVHFGGKASSQVPLATAKRRAKSEFIYFRKHYGLKTAYTHLMLNFMGNLGKGILITPLGLSKKYRSKALSHFGYARAYLAILLSLMGRISNESSDAIG